ncbi:MAG: hypothetical protein U5K75_01465 [Ahrensia sp.]|nr:hypothetical protein [Ahrensia sp.]
MTIGMPTKVKIPARPYMARKCWIPARIYNWAWDARPFPVFPLNTDLWGDGVNWGGGHWLNGRLGIAYMADAIRAIFGDHRLEEPVLSNVDGCVTGIVIGSPNSARGTIEPLASIKWCNSLGRWYMVVS